MPIIVNDFKKKQEISPKYFSDTFTGDGSSNRGLLNPNMSLSNPSRIFNDVDFTIEKKEKSSSNGVEIEKHPIDPLSYHQHMMLTDLMFENIERNETLISVEDNSYKGKIYMSVSMLNATYKKIKTKNASNGKYETEFNPTYRVSFYAINDKDKPVKSINKAYMRAKSFMYNSANTFFNSANDYDLGLIQTIGKNENNLISYFTNDVIALIKYMFDHYSTNMDYDKVINYVTNITDYSLIYRASKIWNETLKDYLKNYLPYTLDNNANSIITRMNTTKFVEKLESFKIDLEVYQDIYDIIINNFSKDEAKEIIRNNQNLLLCDTLINIKNNKDKLPEIKDIKKSFPQNEYSNAQFDAITTTSPLVMISAGAGCGKTKTIEGRIDYLIKSDINPDDITVLSFSNAAADNVKERNSSVRSMTIAKMIHTIYSENFKSHQIATLETFINSVKIKENFKNVKDITVDKFISYLYKILNNKDNGFMKMNALIEDEYDEIIKILNELKLTTLELEIMIAYQKINSLKVPDSVKTKHIIIDEVQDNSIFEFIYALKYVKEFRSSIYLMGE